MIITKQEAKKLDKFYTKQEVANSCYCLLRKILNDSGSDLSKILFIEPAAGSGRFLECIEEHKIGFDILPEGDTIIKNDFLTGDILQYLTQEQLDFQMVFIGNPPFGKKAELAIKFINKCLEYSGIVGFIIPIQFRKWSGQSKINWNAKLIIDNDIPDNSFEFMGKEYNVRCCFQVWTTNSFASELSDLRIQVKPPTKHNDFSVYQFNRTEEAKKYFDYDWDFAVLRQGHGDYNFKAYHKDDCDMKKQWIFFKANNKVTLQRLLSLDFTKLSQRNISTPGFGIADIIDEYISNFEKERKAEENILIF
jgi:hypothetical protein